MNAAGLALLEQFEGLQLKAYRDLAGIWTIGYGHTGGVREGDVISIEQATALLKTDLYLFEAAMPLGNENRRAAMTCLAYNIGLGSAVRETGFRSSSVLQFHVKGMFAEAADAFLRWDKAHVDGQLVVVNGLLRRRMAERELYLRPIPMTEGA